MKSLMHPIPAVKPVPEHEQKQVALAYLREAWAEARLDGVEDDCLAQACLFTALAELVSTYGEDAARTTLERREEACCGPAPKTSACCG